MCVMKRQKISPLIVFIVIMFFLAGNGEVTACDSPNKENMNPSQFNSRIGQREQGLGKRKLPLGEKDNLHQAGKIQRTAVTNGNKQDCRRLNKTEAKKDCNTRPNPKKLKEEIFVPDLLETSYKQENLEFENTDHEKSNLEKLPLAELVSGESPLEGLPPELVEHILSFIPPIKHLHIAIISSYFNGIIQKAPTYIEVRRIAATLGEAKVQLGNLCDNSKYMKSIPDIKYFEDILQNLSSMSFFCGEKLQQHKEQFIKELHEKIKSTEIIKQIKNSSPVRFSHAASFNRPYGAMELINLWLNMALLKILTIDTKNNTYGLLDADISKLSSHRTNYQPFQLLQKFPLPRK